MMGCWCERRGEVHICRFLSTADASGRQQSRQATPTLNAERCAIAAARNARRPSADLDRRSDRLSPVRRARTHDGCELIERVWDESSSNTSGRSSDRPACRPRSTVDLYYSCVSEKVPAFKLSVTLSNLNRFSKFLHRWKASEICYKPVRHYLPHLRHVATLPREITNSNFLRHNVYVL